MLLSTYHVKFQTYPTYNNATIISVLLSVMFGLHTWPLFAAPAYLAVNYAAVCVKQKHQQCLILVIFLYFTFS